jgi:hypothetical protein
VGLLIAAFHSANLYQFPKYVVGSLFLHLCYAKKKKINILKRARYDYEIIEKFTVELFYGTEIKSIRLGKAILPKVFVSLAAQNFCNQYLY